MDMNHQRLISQSIWEPSHELLEWPHEDHHLPLHDHHHHQMPSLVSNNNNNNPSWPIIDNYNFPLHQNPQILSPSTQLLVPSQGGLPSSTNPHHQMEDHQDLMLDEPEDHEELGAMKEMMFKIAAMQPVDIDPATIRKPKRRNVRISDDPQSVAARLRREKISEKIRILQRLVPGGTKMDTASMLDEAIRYVKFLKRQIRQLQGGNWQVAAGGVITTKAPPCTTTSSTTAAASSSVVANLMADRGN